MEDRDDTPVFYGWEKELILNLYLYFCLLFFIAASPIRARELYEDPRCDEIRDIIIKSHPMFSTSL